MPQVLNLTPIKAVGSMAKLLQVIGRGMQLCPDVPGPWQHKRKGKASGGCQNFELSSRHTGGAPASMTSLPGKRL